MHHVALFVLSDMRSGSTLLDQIMGAHPKVVSVGEVHWLPAYARQDRSIYNPAHELVCTCGQPVQVCEFWRGVSIALGRPFESLRLRPAFAAWGRKTAQSWGPDRILRRFAEAYPATFRLRSIQRLLAGSSFVRDSLALFEAIFAVAGLPLLVDSSKSPYRFRAIHDAEPMRARALILARDYRAVVHSKMKRGQSLESAALGWRNRMTQIETLTSDLPPACSIKLRYEDLCADPARELARICQHLGIDFSGDMLMRPTRNTHHIGGSPSKFDSSRVMIRMDSEYLDAFDGPALARLRRLVGGIATRWGY